MRTNTTHLFRDEALKVVFLRNRGVLQKLDIIQEFLNLKSFH